MANSVLSGDCNSTYVRPGHIHRSVRRSAPLIWCGERVPSKEEGEPDLTSGCPLGLWKVEPDGERRAEGPQPQ